MELVLSHWLLGCFTTSVNLGLRADKDSFCCCKKSQVSSFPISGVSISISLKHSLWLFFLPCIMSLRFASARSLWRPSDFLVILDFLQSAHLDRLVHLTLLGNAQIKKLPGNKILEQFTSSFLSPKKGSLHAPIFVTLWYSENWWRWLKDDEVKKEEWGSRSFFPLGKTSIVSVLTLDIHYLQILYPFV